MQPARFAVAASLSLIVLLATPACGPRQPVDPLAGLDSPDPEQRADAEERLQDIAEEIEGGGDWTPEQIARTGQALSRSLEKPADRSVTARRDAVASLARLGWDMPAEAVPKLYAALDDPDPFVRGHAVAGIYRWAKRHRISREEAARWRVAAKSTVDELVGWLASPDVEVRRRAARIARDLEGSARDAEDALVRCLDDPDGEVRIQATWALVEMHAKAEGRTTEQLVAKFQDPEKDVRSGIALVIAYRGAAAVPALVAELGADDWGRRKDAAFALGAIGPAARAALPALRARADDAILFEKATVERAIEKIEGRAEPD